MSDVGFIVMEEPIMIPQAATEKIDNTPIEIAQAAKDKVYVVWYDNGCAYEDGYQEIDRIFSNYDDAAKYLDDCGCYKDVRHGYNGEYMIWFPPYDVEYPDFGHYTIREFDLY